MNQCYLIRAEGQACTGWDELQQALTATQKELDVMSELYAREAQAKRVWMEIAAQFPALKQELEQEKACNAESIAMYHRARDRADQYLEQIEQLRAAAQDALQTLRDTLQNSYPAWRTEELDRISDMRIRLSGILANIEPTEKG
jgi:chromosome segregation ATPase